MNNLNFNPNQMENDPLKIPIAVAESHLIKAKPEFQQDDKNITKIILFNVISTLNQTLKGIQPEPDQKKNRIKLEPTLFFEILQRLKKLFLSLQSENNSQDIHFIQKLVKTYQDLSDQLNLMDSLEKKTDFFIHCLLLIDSIYQYPPAHPFTLGYYLKNYTGENWLPFPLMKIIEQLHIEACEDKENSHLAIWIKTIDGLVENLDRNKVSSPHLE